MGLFCYHFWLLVGFQSGKETVAKLPAHNTMLNLKALEEIMSKVLLDLKFRTALSADSATALRDYNLSTVEMDVLHRWAAKLGLQPTSNPLQPATINGLAIIGCWN